MQPDLSAQIESLTMELVTIQSDTGTTMEKEIEYYLHNRLGRLDYFQKHPGHYGQYRLPHDPLQRSVVWGLLKGDGDQTVILMHHHDAVDAFDYTNLKQWAFSPSDLQEKLAGVELSEEVRSDLVSGQWLFGRGTADMKGGAAIQLAVLEAYARRPDFKGNILLLSVPDEELLSADMRGGLKLLLELKRKYQLNYKILINSEPQFKDYDGKGTLAVGSAGKLLPVIYVRGKKTHIGQIYQGFNPVLLLSEIVLHTELNTDYSDAVQGEVSPPPSWSYLRDRKEFYDASIPVSAGGYLSLISLKKSPKELIQQLKQTCEAAFDRVIEKCHRSHKTFCHKMDIREPGPVWTVNVRTFSELYQLALNDSGQKFVDDYSMSMEAIAADVQQQRINMPEATILIIERTLNHVSDLSPMVVIALSPPYYPSIHNEDFQNLSEPVVSLTDHLIRFAQSRWGEEYKKMNFFMGLSDMSYAGLQNAENIVPYIGPNMPLWRKVYDVPFDEMQALSIPVINIGPWGKDVHKFTERVYKKDLYKRTPALLDQAVKLILGEE